MLLLTGFVCLAAVAQPATASAAASQPKHDTGPVTGPAVQSGLKPIGRLRLRRSEGISGSRWGVSCHWIADQHPLTVAQQVEQLASLGAKWAFLVPDWNLIEAAKGRYDWNSPSHRLDDAVEGCARARITPIIQVYGGNRLYMTAGPDPNKRPLADAAKLLDDLVVRPAWHRFLEAMVRRYGSRVKVWEIWNEPNGPWFWKTPATVEDYGRMVRDVATVIKSVDPRAVILAGSTANVPADYLEKFLASEGAGSFDHWSVHPYGAVPEATDAAIRRVQEMLRQRGKSPVLWQSECGFPSSADTGGWGWGGSWDETKHAKWVLRRLLCDAALGMKVSTYFILNDYPALLEGGPNKGQMGINRKGLHFGDTWERKPAAHAFVHLASLLDDRLERVAPNASIEILDASPVPGAKPEILHTCSFRAKEAGSAAVVYWLGVPMETQFKPAKARLTLAEGEIADPVLVDLLDGRVYALDAPARREGRTVFDNLPLGDSPLVLCSRRLVELTP